MWPLPPTMYTKHSTIYVQARQSRTNTANTLITKLNIKIMFSIGNVHNKNNYISVYIYVYIYSFSDHFKNLGVTLESSWPMHQQVTNTYTAAYTELWRINLIRQYLTTEATQTLISAFVLSRLDYCNSLLSGVSQYQLDRLHRVQNAAATARLTVKASESDHMTPILHSLHWLSGCQCDC